MTYSIIATSLDDARPINLYKFSYSGNNWFYTSADTEVVFDSITYVPVPMMRSAISSESDPTKASLTISLPGTSPIGELFRVSPPSEQVSVTVFETNYLDVSSYVIVWKGRILTAEWNSFYELEITTESVFSSAQRQGIRRRVQKGCPLALYGDECGVSESDWEEISVVTSVAGPQLIVSAAIGKIDNYYAGGKITWVNSVRGNTEKRMIDSSVGATGVLNLSSNPIGLATSQSVKIYAGCSHALEDVNGCVKFNNFIRYGGDPYIPPKGPFGGTAIF